MPNGFIIYEGKSLLDNKKIVAIALTSKSMNNKTGNMIQTYILLADIDPRKANKSGLDYSICGACTHRGNPTQDKDRKLAKNRSCYVVIPQGPLIVWKNYKLGKYPKTNDIPGIGKDKKIRLGTYGDPSVVPSSIWEQLLSQSISNTAYSHQSNIKCSSFNPDYMMLSADNLGEAQQAWKNNIRTFRTIKDIKEIIKGNEVSCPASEEGGRKTTCLNCMLCSGSKINAKSIAIVVHGAGRNNFN